MSKPTEPVVLDRRWDVGTLLGETFRLFQRHAVLFLTITAIVAVPFIVAVNLLWGEQLASEDFTGVPWEAFVVPTLVGATVLPALITALHVVALLRIAEGEQPSVREAFALAAERAPAAIGATALYTLAVAFGLLALIVPGIWLAVRLYFGAQAAVVDRLAPMDAIRRSAELVRDRWWQTLGRMLLAGIVFTLITIPLTVPLALIEFGAVYVALDAIVQTIVLSLTALFGTLMFMDYHGHPRDAVEPGYGGFEPPQPSTPEPFGRS